MPVVVRHRRGVWKISRAAPVTGLVLLLLLLLVTLYLNASYHGAFVGQTDRFVSQSRPVPPPFLKRTASRTWKVWDPRDGVWPLHDAAMAQCQWTTFRPAVASNLPGMPPWPRTSHTAVSMCVHAHDTSVSESIRQLGRWQECDILSSLVYTNGNAFYLEVGANIGSCLLQVLLTTNATIVAFEPSPLNLFKLTSTLMALPDISLLQRVWLFPIGLGEASNQGVIYTARANPGHSMIGSKVYQSKEYLAPMTIYIERLDTILDATRIPPRDLVQRSGGISTVKLDAEGYECSVVRGMMALIRFVHIVKFENEPSLLEASVSKCSSALLYQLWTRPVAQGGANFRIHALYQDPTTIGDQFDSYPEDVQDVLAMPLNYSIIEVEWR